MTDMSTLKAGKTVQMRTYFASGYGEYFRLERAGTTATLLELLCEMAIWNCPDQSRSQFSIVWKPSYMTWSKWGNPAGFIEKPLRMMNVNHRDL
jgi:hypothetical protein